MCNKQLAHEHWEYIEKVLRTAGETEEVIRKIKFHYITAFIHGYKHAVEEIENEWNNMSDKEDIEDVSVS